MERRVDKSDSKDVTEEFVDVRAQVENLETTERQLRALMDKAQRIEDIMSLQREITNIRGQIERLQGRANYLDRRAAMSTITIHVEPEPRPTPTPSPTPEPTPSPTPQPTPSPTATPGWSVTRDASLAWDSSMTLLQAVTSVVVTILVFFWWILVPLGLGWSAYRLYRRVRSPRPAPSASTPTTPAVAPMPSPATEAPPVADDAPEEPERRREVEIWP